MPDKKHIAVGFVSAAVMFFTLFAAGLFLLSDPVLNDTLAFYQTARDIALVYPFPSARRLAFDAAERELFSLLDPFSFRIDRNEFEYLREESSGEYGGIGITVVARDTVLMVMSVREGGPAYEGGMKSGDLITAVCGKSVPRDDPASATDLIRGPSGTIVDLIIYRPAIKDTLHLTLTRSNIRLEHLPYYGLTESGIAYIRIADFEAGAADDLENALLGLEKLRPGGYIIDLKGNPGGYLNEAIDAADFFLDDGVLIVGTDGRSRWENRRYLSSSDPLTDKPVVILTDYGTASAAEIFTGALRGAGRGVIIGDTTFGKGLVQSVYGLPNGDAIRLTISRYYFADGTYLNPPDTALAFSGLAPDIDYSDRGELAFRELILSGFLIYDFVEFHWDLLAGFPDNFSYPDTVITLFENFVASRNISYTSWLTELLSLSLMDQRLEQASDAVLNRLEMMLDQSVQLDSTVFRRRADELKYHIRRIVVEKKHGPAASYREVIVPGRADIRLAAELLSDLSRYRQYLTPRTALK